MDKKDQFKTFVKKNPSLISYVHNGDMSWQKFYELYDLNGEDEKVWKDYRTVKTTNNDTTKAAASVAGTVGLAEIFKWIKGIDLDSFQSGIGSLQKVVGVLQGFVSNNPEDGTTPKEAYKPRPLYRHFED